MIQAQIESQLTQLPCDYGERVYAGVLGKIIGVYAGRPVENWSYERIAERFGEIRYFVHEQLGRRLIITDDDISGTFVFLRALSDHGSSELSAQQIGESWLNYLIEKKTILWWGGLGNSTEHTAFLRLKSGIQAPESGSIARNGQVVAEQIGAQIFIDGWGLVCPGDPVRATRFAREAAAVSHDGEAIFGAQVIAALVSQAFVESDLDRLIDTALGFIPSTSTIATLIHDLRNWHRTEPDWRENRLRLEAKYGYDKYGGNCHMVPNHGAIILSLLHGGGDFSESLHIVNTIGWDTDCNSGNLGCILGVRNGLAGFEQGLDWRGPVADRLFLPCANPGIAITDALRVADQVANLGRGLAGVPEVSPKNGARFHFSLPGSVQGFRVEPSFPSRTSLSLGNEEGMLQINYQGVGPGCSPRVFTDTFIPIETKDLVTGYVLVASPTLQPGQLVRARLCAPASNPEPIEASIYIRSYDGSDALRLQQSKPQVLHPSESASLEWEVPNTDAQPIAEVGIQLSSSKATSGRLELDWLNWTGVPNAQWTPGSGTMWARAWGAALDRFEFARDGFKHLAQDRGTGLLIMGSDHWDNYRVESTAWVQMASSFGIAARVQGLRRYYALVLSDHGEVQIRKCLGSQSILASSRLEVETYRPYRLRLEVNGSQVRGYIDGKLLLEVEDMQPGLEWGGCAFVIEEGCMGAEGLSVAPLD